ncbi:D-xylulose kinase A [Saitoella complicata NRRL Y-17804]|uniref:Xylulose kinase n=1 Tax=Saitoella complicata (strain BCRC 22490 / CBS 7301 / JCM 7358 / NBRC 10748 / NRRL Y-17804) TaxID=698492 RepID=A0A0E9N9Z7_SAICN|nr:D-xylulose kinase A [Saitoella complicata NRRL Y-17804]ODQ51338.1 D-xylulose kinase A [Saitoella complicata NRRL Y-17804]GAO46618.1 hypothetical protein G7K_0845-t1 [Saitoella complicata NRRL Y-17804]
MEPRPDDLFLGCDLSTQQLKIVAINSSLQTIHEAACHFDNDLPQYKTTSGVHVNGDEIAAPVEMWIAALDLVLQRMKDEGFEFGRVRGISGAGQQHGSVYWSREAEGLLAALEKDKTLVEQLSPKAFTHPISPNWQDHSTSRECADHEAAVGSAEKLAEITGSKAHERFTGPQILKLRRNRPEVYHETYRISLVSSFLSSLFLGSIAPIDIADVCGMNLWDISSNTYSQRLVSLVSDNPGSLIQKLGIPETDGGRLIDYISPYFVHRYGFPTDCCVVPFTGDNPATLLSFPLRPLDVIISLGTSTTLLVTTPTYITDPGYHMFAHPTTPGLYMAMLCYKNGALARLGVRDAVSKVKDTWDEFTKIALETPVLGRENADDPAKLGFYFPLSEIIPAAPSGTWRFLSNGELEEVQPGGKWDVPRDDVRTIIESQALSMRLRSQPLLAQGAGRPGKIWVVGGGSSNPAINNIIGQVFGAREGVYKLLKGAANACALGGANKAAWGVLRKKGETFEDFMAARWEAEGGGRSERVVQGMKDGEGDGIWEKYGEVLGVFEEAERRVVASKNGQGH